MAVTVTRDSKSWAMTTGGETGLTVEASSTYELTMIQVSNIDGANDADATVSWTDASNEDYEAYLAKTVTVAAKDSLSVAAGGLILAAGDTLKTAASADGDLQITVSYIKRTTV